MSEQIIGNRDALESGLEQVRLLAPTDSAVFIDRETGTKREFTTQVVCFTGAIAETIERFEMADQSTLFLDDVNAKGNARATRYQQTDRVNVLQALPFSHTIRLHGASPEQKDVLRASLRSGILKR